MTGKYFFPNLLIFLSLIRFCRVKILKFEVQFIDYFLLWIVLLVSYLRTMHQSKAFS